MESKRRILQKFKSQVVIEAQRCHEPLTQKLGTPGQTSYVILFLLKHDETTKP
jgi:hypothetical protein